MARVIPGPRLPRLLGAALAIVLIALVAGAPVATVALATGAAGLFVAVALAWDGWRSLRDWRHASPTVHRTLPAAFALGVTREVRVAVTVGGAATWHGRFHDHADPDLRTAGLPVDVALAPNKLLEATYTAQPTRRGDVRFAPAVVRLRSGWGLVELVDRVGSEDARRVYPDFAQVARYAWLAGDRRLQEIGVKTYRRRGEGTDFRQLREYRVGDALRHLDWRATLRHDRPIVREFQDERDQCVMLLIDCGRRMRADDRTGGIGGTHFDQVLNAVMLLAYVALRQGDAVGCTTFGVPAGQERAVPPRKGVRALAGLMSGLYDVQPTASHSDYVAAAREFVQRQRRRALVVIITNFRDEDSPELQLALRLLRRRHLVLLASLRERIIDELTAQPLTTQEAVAEVAGAHWYAQTRRDAFNRLAVRDRLMIDAAPERLGAELVNRYNALKRAGSI